MYTVKDRQLSEIWKIVVSEGLVAIIALTHILRGIWTLLFGVDLLGINLGELLYLLT